MSEKWDLREYLVILEIHVRVGPHSGTRTREIKIECDQYDLTDEIEREKQSWKEEMERFDAGMDSERYGDDPARISVTVKQVLPL